MIPKSPRNQENGTTLYNIYILYNFFFLQLYVQLLYQYGTVSYFFF